MMKIKILFTIVFTLCVVNLAAAASSATGKDNGHEYVDLGLSVKWATCNVGANTPEEYGDYYAWGESRTKSIYDWSTYELCTQAESKTNSDPTYGIDYITGKYDAATMKWGKNWRLPTGTEMLELKDKCTWTWTTAKGVHGYKVTGPNGKSIFLPAAGFRADSRSINVGTDGYYWTSERGVSSLDNRAEGFYLYFASSDYIEIAARRVEGLSIRPVKK